LEYTLENRSKRKVDYEFSYHLSHFAQATRGGQSSRNEVIPGGVNFYNEEDANAETYGSGSLTVIGHRPKVKAMWFRGGWFDCVSALWREVSTGAFKTNTGDVTPIK